MGQSHTDFHRRIGRAAHMKREQRTFALPNKSARMHRNERITAMLERQDAFSKDMPASKSAPLEVKTFWTPYVASFLALAMGALAALIARYIRFQLTGSLAGAASADLDLLIDVVFAIAIAFLLRELVSLSAIRQMGAQFAGVLLALVTMHNVVHHNPEVFSRLFSAEWVSHVTQTTDPGTLLFRGQSFAI